MMQFAKAARIRSKARIGLIGPSGSGKTYSALSIATGLGDKIALIDTEHGSASLYADDFPFDALELDNFHPQHYIDAIVAAGKAGYEVLVIDSLSHAWAGTGGALELADKGASRYQGNRFAAWKDVTPLHTKLIEAMLSCPCHLIATMRSKTEYVQDKDEKGKTTIRKVGTAPIQRDGMEYEFSVVGDLDLNHNLIVSKTRYKGFDGAVIPCPGQEFGQQLRTWLEEGAEAPPRVETSPKAEAPKTNPAAQRAAVFATLAEFATEKALDPNVVTETAKTILREAYKVESCGDMTDEQWGQVRRGLSRLMDKVVERIVVDEPPEAPERLV